MIPTMNSLPATCRPVRALRSIVAMTLLLLSAGSTLFAQIPIEDRSKHIILTPPSDWKFDSASNSDRLGFLGPKASGITSSLSVRCMIDGRVLEAVEASLLSSELKVEASQIEETTPLEAIQLSGIDRAVSFLRNVKGKRSRLVLALTRHGPYVLSLTFVMPDSLFTRKQSVVTDCLASVQAIPLTPVFEDRQMGIRFFDLPEGFEVDAEATVVGEQVRWKLERDGASLGGLSAKVVDWDPDSDFPEWVAGQLEDLKADEKLRNPTSNSFYLSGEEGALIEYIIEFQGGSLLNTRWVIAVPMKDRLYMLDCSAESTNFEQNMRPLFDRFMRSIEIEVEAEE